MQRCRRRRLTQPMAVGGRRSARHRSRLRAGGARRRETGRHAAVARALDPPPDRDRDRHRRAAGSRRRQPAARAARPTRSCQGRRGRARRALSGSPARDQSGHGARRSRAPRRASRRSACRRRGFRPNSAIARPPPATPWSIPTTALSTHLSEIDPHVPAGSADAAADEGDGRPRRADVAEAGRGAGAEGAVARRDPARAAAAPARARAGARPDDDSRIDGGHRRRHQGPRRDHRGRARVARARHLPAVSDRPRRAAGDRFLARCSKSGCLARSCGPIRVPFWRSIRRKRRVSPRRSRARSKQPWHSLCFCARQRSGRTSGDCSRGCCRTSECSRTTKYRRTSGLHRSRCWTDMHLKRFRGETVRDALAGARAELGPDALVLSTQLVPAGGWRGLLGAREVEVTAATEREVSEPRSARQEVRQPEPGPLTSSLVARLEAAGFAAVRRSRREAGARDQRPAERERRSCARCREPVGCAVRRGGRELHGGGGVHRTARRRQDDDRRQDRGAGARPAWCAAAPRFGGRLPRGRRRAAAALRRDHRRAVRGGTHAGRSRSRSDRLRAGRFSSTPPAVRRVTVPPARCCPFCGARVAFARTSWCRQAAPLEKCRASSRCTPSPMWIGSSSRSSTRRSRLAQ